MNKTTIVATYPNNGTVAGIRTNGGKQKDPVTFNRIELNTILGIYGKMVGAGYMRDYAISMQPDLAVFSMFQRASERPLYRVEKDPKRAARQGAYAVVGQDGRILKRGHELASVLKVLERKLLKLVE